MMPIQVYPAKMYNSKCLLQPDPLIVHMYIVQHVLWI